MADSISTSVVAVEVMQLGATHGLENQTSEPLEIIEIQSGSYLGEDDIVRFEDIYGRTES